MSSLVMEIEDYELSAGQPTPVSRRATYFLLMVGSDVDVEFSFKGSRIGGGRGLQGGDAVGPLSQAYDQVTLTSATAQTVKVATSSDPVTITRLSGVVQIDGVVQTAPDYSRVLVGESYIAGRTVQPSSGLYGYIQIFNPTTETRDMVVPSIIGSGPGGIFTVILTSDEMTAANFSGFGELPGRSMLLENPLKSSAKNVLFSGYSASIAALTNAENISSFPTGRVETAQPFVLKPGTGVVFRSATTNESVSMNVEYFWIES